jgi:mRNA interferase RelE/StbE
MNSVFLASFLSDVKKLRDGKVQKSIAQVITRVEQAPSLRDIPSLKRLSGYQSYYRICVGDWRIGLKG